MHVESSTVVQIIRGDNMDTAFKILLIILMVLYFFDALAEKNTKCRIISGSIGVAIAATYIAARVLL